jgi:hypothetical protein
MRGKRHAEVANGAIGEEPDEFLCAFLLRSADQVVEMTFRPPRIRWPWSLAQTRCQCVFARGHE